MFFKQVMPWLFWEQPLLLLFTLALRTGCRPIRTRSSVQTKTPDALARLVIAEIRVGIRMNAMKVDHSRIFAQVLPGAILHITWTGLTDP
jgi:hypothetical protein